MIDYGVEDPELGPAEARTYRGVAARLNYIAPDRADLSYAVKEAARSMSKPKESDLKKLRKIGKYLIGQPRLVIRFAWQDMPSRVTAFTDSDWAGCARSAKSTSGGALCLGEHVIKTFCKQQKVVALSSAEAELYAMVATSAETLALQAYARDLGLELECELHCDSSAALGISQRAGIGKVRHLRTQGLWVQETRVSGRIKYLKVLGEKNPADLMTKHMSAELASKHLGTLNMALTEGRSDAAPTLDSLVRAWYSDSGDADDPNNDDGDRRVRFSSRVQFRGIPAVGRQRRTPPRQSTGRRFTTAWSTGARSADSVDLLKLHGNKNIIDEDMMTRGHEKMGSEGPVGAGGAGARWADLESDSECTEYAANWSNLPRTLRREVLSLEQSPTKIKRASKNVARTGNRQDRAVGRSSGGGSGHEGPETIPHECKLACADGECLGCDLSCADRQVANVFPFSFAYIERARGGRQRRSGRDRALDRLASGGCQGYRTGISKGAVPSPPVGAPNSCDACACLRLLRPSACGIGRRRSVKCGAGQRGVGHAHTGRKRACERAAHGVHNTPSMHAHTGACMHMSGSALASGSSFVV